MGPAILPDLPPLPAGRTRLGSYRVVRPLGRGAMGAVYEAVAADGSPVALKVLPPWLASDADARRGSGHDACGVHQIHHQLSVARGEFRRALREGRRDSHRKQDDDYYRSDCSRHVSLRAAIEHGMCQRGRPILCATAASLGAEDDGT